MTTRYDNGRRFEWRVRDALRADGYTVLRTRGSRSPVDLIAFKGLPLESPVIDHAANEVRWHQMLFVQCKRTTGTIGPDEREALRDLAATARAIPVVAYQPAPRKPLAYRQLTGPGPKDWQPWTPDEVANTGRDSHAAAMRRARDPGTTL